MLKNLLHIVKYIIMVALATLVSSVILMYVINADEYKTDYVSGKYGEYCYVEGNESGLVEYIVKFETLEECTDYVKTNR